MIAVSVSRASQVHHTPQVGFPQIMPSTIARPVKKTPISAEDAATRSHRKERVARYPTLPTSVTKKAK